MGVAHGSLHNGCLPNYRVVLLCPKTIHSGHRSDRHQRVATESLTAGALSHVACTSSFSPHAPGELRDSGSGTPTVSRAFVNTQLAVYPDQSCIQHATGGA